MVVLTQSRAGWWRLTWALALASGTAALAASQHATEYEVKAACLYRFAKFVEWPAACLPDGTGPIVIGIIGVDPFGDILDDAIKGKTVNDRPVEIRRFARIDDITKCHILFVSRSERQKLGQILGRREVTCALTVGESDEFVQRGGMINFRIKDKRVVFEISQVAAERAGLKISSQLLKLGIVINPEPVTEPLAGGGGSVLESPVKDN